MPAYTLPPWIGRPADPAAHYAQGFQIGVHLGAQQAAQMFQQQQMAMQHQKELMAEQQQEVENQYNSQVLNLKASELARKHQANQIFQARIAQGEDPSQVLMQLAPELGESPTSVLHTQAIRDQSERLARYREANLQRMADAAAGRDEIARAQIASREKIASEKETFSSKVDRLSKLQQAFDAASQSGDPAAIEQTRRDLEAAKAFIPSARLGGLAGEEPVVRDVNGVKIAYVPGSKQIHIVPNEPSKRAFMSKAIPVMLRDGIKPEDAISTLGKAFDLMNPSGEQAPSKPEGKFVVGKIYKDKNGNKAVFQADGTFQPIK